MYPQQKNIFSDNKPKKLRLFSLSLWIIGILILTAVSLPFVIKQSSIHYFLELQNADNAAIENVDLNLFAGRLVFDNLEVQKANFETLHVEKLVINIDWLPLFSRRFSIRSFLIRNANLQLDISTPNLLSVNGLTFQIEPDDRLALEKANSNTRWEFGLQEAYIANSQIIIKQNELNSTVAIQSVTFSNFVSWLPTQSTIFKTKFTLDDASILFEGTTKPFQPTLPLTARFTVDRLDLARITPLIKNDTITALKGTVKSELNIKSAFVIQDQYDVKVEGYVNTTGFQGAFSDNVIAHDQLSWSGLTQLSLNTRNNYFSIFNKGTTELQGFNYVSTLTGLALSSRVIASEGQLSYDSNPANLTKNPNDNEDNTTGSPLHFTGRLQAADLKAIDHKNQMTLTTMQSIELPKIELGGIRHINIPTLTILQARFLSLSEITDSNINNNDVNNNGENSHENNRNTDDDATNSTNDADNTLDTVITESDQNNSLDFLLTIDQTIINNIQLNPDEELNITDILLAGTNAQLEKKADGKLKYIEEVMSTFAGTQLEPPAEPIPAVDDTLTTTPADVLASALTTPPSNTEGEIPSFIVRIGIIEVGGDSQLVFKDDSITPNYQTNLSNVKLKIVGLNNQDKSQNSQIDLVATADNTAKISLNGFIQPFSSPINAQVFANIANLELPPLSSYTASSLGYHLKRGRASAELSINIVNGNLESKNDIVISQLNLEQKDDEDIKNLTEELSLPLDKALDLLRDREGNITIALPVTGNVNDPDFDFTPTINKAMGKAIRSATLSYVEHALQPWSTLLTVAKIAGKRVNKVKFEPLLFNVGSAHIRKENHDYLNKISSLLKDRPSLEITTCGIASLQDKLALSRMANNNKSDAINSKANNSGSAQASAPIVDKKTLLKLAKKRSKNVINYLVNRKKIDSKRLFTCNPTYLNRNSAPPSVEFIL